MSLENAEDAYALSPMQSGMLYDSLAAPEQDTYVTYVSFDIEGEIDCDCLRLAWQAVFARHQSLRAAFFWDGLDQPLQVIVKEISLPWTELDWSGVPQGMQQDSMQDLLLSERKNKIDLSSAPLSRFTLIKRAPEVFSLLWSVHHLLADGSSTPVILNEVLQEYQRLNTEPTPAVKISAPSYQYAEYIHWLSSQDKQTALEYWRGYFSDVKPSPVKLRRLNPGIGNRALSHVTPSVETNISTAQSREINEYCKHRSISLSTFFHGAWALLLREYAGSDKVLFASTVSGRQSDVEGMDTAVGMYLNAQPRVVSTDDKDGLTAWFQGIQRDIHRSAAYDHVSLGDVLKVLDYNAAEEPVDSIITIAAHPKSMSLAVPGSDIRFSQIRYQVARSHYALALIVTPGDEFELSLVYHDDKYDCTAIEPMLHFLQEIIQAILSAADAFLPSEVCTEVALQAGLRSKNPAQSTFQYKDHTPARTVHGWFESVADAQPDKVAIRFNDVSCSYTELDQAANKIANLLRDSNYSSSNTPIGLMLPRGIEQIAGMLGILKASCAYTPIDIDIPAVKLQLFLQSENITAVVTYEEYAPLVESSGAVAVRYQDAAHSSIERIRDTNITEQSLAYVMYTSGSTGQPKGVKITHANLLYSTSARIHYYKNSAPVFLLLSSIIFDSSVAGIYWCLCGGGTLVLPKPDEEKDIDAIVATIGKEAVSHTLCLPSYYQLLLENSNVSLTESLKAVIVAGEACSAALVNTHFEKHPTTKMFNEYGPTEACVWSSVKQFTHPVNDEVTIGIPIGNTYLQVANAHGNICPPGVEGEIVIGGDGVSPGYLNDTLQTKQRFVPNSAACPEAPILYRTGDTGFFNQNNELVFTGRIDRQLKIRGFRVEPVEIEGVLNQYDGIARSVVVALNQSALHKSAHSGSMSTSHADDRKVLVAYLLVNQQQPNTVTCASDDVVHEVHDVLDESVLLQFCRDRLASHMCPARFVALNRLPLLANGKVALSQLPVPTRKTGSDTLYSADVQSKAVQLASILEELLTVENVHPSDNFFAIGGDSITAIQFISKARKTGMNINVAAVSRSATISEIASHSTETQSSIPSKRDPQDEETDTKFSASGLDKDDLDDFLDGFSD